MDCIFCKIVSGDIPSTKVYEDEFVYAFNDINPVAPVHVLVVPKVHISCADDVNFINNVHIGKVFEAIAKIAKQLGIRLPSKNNNQPTPQRRKMKRLLLETSNNFHRDRHKLKMILFCHLSIR